MAQATEAALPPNVDLDLNCQLVFEAVDPTTGDPVSGVTISNALFRVETGDIGADLSSGPFMLVPGPESGPGTGSSPGVNV